MSKMNLNGLYDNVSISANLSFEKIKSSITKSAIAAPALLLAGAVPADGQVICNDAAAPIVASGTFVGFGGTGVEYIDVDGDGVDDFAALIGTTLFSYPIAGIIPLGSNQNINAPSAALGVPLIANISSGFSVGSTLPTGYSFTQGNPFLYYGLFAQLGLGVGNFPMSDPSGLMGFVFESSGNFHFGWMEVTVGFELDFPNPSTLTVSQFCYESTPLTSISAGEREAIVPIPTVGEWGLITLAFLLLSFGTVSVMRKEGVLDVGGSTLNIGVNKPIFSSDVFKKALPYTIALGAILSIGSWITTGTITTVDIFGGLIAGSVLTYWAHLVMLFKKEND